MPSKLFDELLTRIKGEFMEMPGLRLTADQGSRLWGLDRDECRQLLRVLIDRGFLNESADGTYGRLSELTAVGPHRMAKAALSGDRPARAGMPAGRRAGER